jgi:hypothetical protein
MSDNKPFSIIIADSMEAVKKIHATRELPPLVSWKEESDRLEAQAQGANETTVALAAAHLKAGYLMKLRDATLYVLIEEQILRQQDAMRAARFPEKAFFVANECWIHIDGFATNIRDRSGGQGMYKIDEIPVPFDLLTVPQFGNGATVLQTQLVSRAKGYIATLIDTNAENMRMSVISVADHLTGDLTDPAEYTADSISAVPFKGEVPDLPAETWVLRRHITGTEIVHHLGYFTNEDGAKAALEYLKSYPR